MKLTDTQKLAVIAFNAILNAGSHPALLQLHLLCVKILSSEVAAAVKEKRNQKDFEKQCDEFYRKTVYGKELPLNAIDLNKKVMSKAHRFTIHKEE